MLSVDAAGRAFIAREEGTVLHGYLDQAGKLTIGTGHLVRTGEPYTLGGAITAQQADALLVSDLRVAESAVRAHSPDTITQAQFDACVSLAFNIGGGAFARSSVASLMSAGDWHAAADAFLLWDKIGVGGKLEPSQALAARRMREREMFLSGAT